MAEILTIRIRDDFVLVERARSGGVSITDRIVPHFGGTRMDHEGCGGWIGFRRASIEMNMLFCQKQKCEKIAEIPVEVKTWDRIGISPVRKKRPRKTV